MRGAGAHLQARRGRGRRPPGLDLSVDPGEVVAIVGASGSGKSTLLSILSALDVPSAGTVRVAGADLMVMSRAERVRYRRHTVGFLFQQASHNLLPYLTASENVALPMTLAGVAARERGSQARHLLEVAGVPEVAERTMAELSGGQQQRVAVDEHGAETVVAEEYAVLDRAGRPQLPQDFTTALAMRELVRLDLEVDHIGVWPTSHAESEQSEEGQG